jgi:hypothetical protein
LLDDNSFCRLFERVGDNKVWRFFARGEVYSRAYASLARAGKQTQREMLST